MIILDVWLSIASDNRKTYASRGVVSSSLNIWTVSVFDEQARNSPQGEKDRL